METKRTGLGVPSPQTAQRKVATVAWRVIRLWRRRRTARRPILRSPGVGLEHRLEALEARMEHLEAAFEGLQDAVYRQAVLEHENIGELRRRTEPEQMARDLSGDTRRRGL